jgi:hypothetical protein
MKQILLCILLIGQFLFVSSAYAVKTDAELRARSIDSSRTLESRVRALKKLYRHLLVDGEIPERRTCVWDVLGRQGPIYAATIDMQVRLKFYGINLDVVAYTDEEEAIKGLESGFCDSAVITGVKANKFNSFTGSIEALGGLTSKKQMSLLLQVLSSPKAMPKMQDEKYVVIGVIPLGENFLMSTKSNASIASIMSGRASRISNDASQESIFKKFSVPSKEFNILADSIRAFRQGETDVMLAPKVTYNMFSLGQAMAKGVILDYPVSQMTLQIVGNIDRIPPEVALILREDLFIKFNYLYREVKKNNRNIPNSVLKQVSQSDQQLLSKTIADIRKENTKSGVYNKSMIKLQDRIRCKLDRSLPLCKRKSR